jgi:hypothetical protein
VQRSPLPWIVGIVLALAALSVVCCLGLAYIGSTIEPTPTPGATSTTVTLQLSELTAANQFQVDKDVRGANGSKIGVVSMKAGYSYEQQGSPELMGTIEVLLNNKMVLELAASNQAAYAETNPQFEVATAGKTYPKTSDDGWQIATTVDTVAVTENPPLANGKPGQQPVFSDLALTLAITPAP